MSNASLKYNFNNLTKYSLELSNRTSDLNFFSDDIDLLPWDALMFKK